MDKTRTVIIDGIEIQTNLTGVEIADLEQKNKELIQKIKFNEKSRRKMQQSLMKQIDTLEQQFQKQKEINQRAIEYITSYESISTIQGLTCIEANKQFDEKTMTEMTNRYLLVHDKLLEILEDKEVLTRVVDIWKDADKNEIWSKSSFATKNCLGIYKTKERALEVLDEIQNIIYINKLFNADIKAFKKSLEIEGYTEKEISKALKTISTYEMPKE